MAWITNKIRGGLKCLKENGFWYTLKLFIKKIGNKRIKMHTEGYDGKFLKIIYLKTYRKEKNIKYVYFFGKQIYPGNRKVYKNNWVDKNQPIIYFKVNRIEDYTKPCVQHWVNIAYHLHADFYFICDNKELEYMILRKVCFPSSRVNIIRSLRKPLQKLVKTLGTKRWEKATYAHLTPFYHAKQNNIQFFWAIDADDTMICLQHKRVAEALMEVQKLSEKDKISTISLDMWRSRTLGRHWSWGVAYVNTKIENIDFIKIFSGNKDTSWSKPYLCFDSNYNLDWFFTYLKDSGKVHIETFYIDNTNFIHWGSFIRNPHGACIYLWQNGKLELPILKYIFRSENLGSLNVADCIKISIDATNVEAKSFWENEVSMLKWVAAELRELNGYGEYAKSSIENL